MTEREALEAKVKLLRDLVVRKRSNVFAFFKPYPKQMKHFLLGATARERVLMAGNQQGKTYAGAFEMAAHLTGEYPSWWPGMRFTHPIRAWAAGVSSIVVRDVMQTLLCGPHSNEELFGTGMIPKSRFKGRPLPARGVPGALDTVYVEHRTDGVVDGISTLVFKSYEQGREKFQADTIDYAWEDEEPSADIHSEILTRTNATGGIVAMTFTPLNGMSTVVARFLDEPTKDRACTIMTIDDALHISPEQRAKIIAGYLPHERDARVYGTPMLGEGRIFPYSDEQIIEPTLEFVPEHWTKLWSIDFGMGHPFAAALMAWDRDADVLHLLHTIRVKDALPLQHAVPMKAVAGNIPVAWPHDGTARQSDGEQLHLHYRRQGLRTLSTHATWPEGGYSTEAGIAEMQMRMETSRFKVGAHLSQYLEEHRSYHRKKGLIVKERDDILSAVRIGVMAKRFGKPGPLGPGRPIRKGAGFASGIDFDLF